VIDSPYWNAGRGAATWSNGGTGASGIISDANSLVGSQPGDQVASYGRALSDGNYVVQSSQWNGKRGAVTWGNGNTGVSGTVSEANSLIGTNPGDQVGGAITPLRNGNYIVTSPFWNGGSPNGLGAVTWGNGSTGVSGAISDTNSLVGGDAGDDVGADGVIPLNNGNYLVQSHNWNGQRGAVTWGNGSTGISGTVSDANSLVGSNNGDVVGARGTGGVTLLSNGNYVVQSRNWNGQRGAVTWGNGRTGGSGIISDANSLVGSNPGDQVGYFNYVTPLSNGNYVVQSPYWNGRQGAVTWGNGSTGTSGTVSDANSVVFSSPGGPMPTTTTVSLTLLSNGNYLVANPSWNGQRGALTWVSGTTGQTLDGKGVITTQNSLMGKVPNAGLSLLLVENPVAQTFLASFPGSGLVTVGLANPNLLTYSAGQSQTVTITPAFLTRTLANGTAIVLQASNDITVNSPITVNAGGNGGALTLQAGRSILLNAPISTDNGALNLIANDQVSNGVVDSQRDPGNAVTTMAGGTFLNTGSGALTAELRDGFGLTNRDSGAITLQTVTAASVSVVNNGPSPGSDVDLGPVASTGPQSYSNPNGTTIVTGNLTASDNTITFNHSVALSAGVTLDAGSGLVNFAGGSVAPSPGAITVASAVAFNGSTTLSVTLNGTDPGSYSQFVAGGPINLTGSTLSLLFGFTPPLGSSFEVLSNTGSAPINGTFNGLDEGTVFTQGSYQFQITYAGGTSGRSVVLTCLA
jgi:hypothetical protein